MRVPIPDVVLPTVFRKIGRRLPVMPPKLALVFTLNQLLKKEILPADMELLAGKRFEIDVLDIGLQICFSANQQKFILDAPQGQDIAFIKLSANAVDFVRMMLQEEDPDTLFFNRKLQIEGDTELGLIVKNLLDSVDWSRTPLSHFVSL